MAYSMNPFSHSTASGSPERGSDELSLWIRMRISTKNINNLRIRMRFSTKKNNNLSCDQNLSSQMFRDPVALIRVPSSMSNLEPDKEARISPRLQTFLFLLNLEFYLHSEGLLPHVVKAELMVFITFWSVSVEGSMSILSENVDTVK